MTPAERSERARATARARWGEPKPAAPKLTPAPCANCGEPLKRAHPLWRYCSKLECKLARNSERMRVNGYNARSRAKLGRPASTRAADARRRAALRGAHIGEPFTIEQVVARDGWLCGICDEPIDASEAYPAKGSLSLDHTVPISRGGAHSFDNARPAHLGCNSRKGAAEA